jgi:transposase
MCDLVSHDRSGHEPVPHRRPPGVPGRAVPVGPPVRPPHPGRQKGQGDTWLRGVLCQAATGAASTATFLGERYHRIARRRGKAKAQVAVARSILVIIWHLLSDPAARFTDLGYGYYQVRTDKDKKIKNHIRQIEALLGHPITITPKAA